MILELHSHTAEHSPCSHVSAVDLIRHCISNDLQGLVLTDHHHLWTPRALSDLLKKCAVPNHFIVLSGQEVRTADFGDVLVFGADDLIGEGTPALEIARRFPDAALVLAHPYRNGSNPDLRVLAHPVFHAIEIFNSNQTILENVRGLQDWHRYRFTATGGTDIHALNYCGTYPTVFDHPVDSIQALAHEIRRGRCRPFLSETPHSGASSTRVTELRIGSPCREGARDRFIVKSHPDRLRWQSGERTHHIMKAVADCGFREGSFRVPVPVGGDEEGLVLIEEGLEGQLLSDRLVRAEAHQAEALIKSAAHWLAKLHRLRLKITPAAEFLNCEPERLERYLANLYKTGNRHADRIRQVADAVSAYEFKWFENRPDLLIQAHGDFHPKNILVGHANQEDSARFFVAAIDFNSYRLPQAYDVGTFLAQYDNQLRPHPHVLRYAPPQLFVETYLSAAGRLPADFLAHVELFKARTALSIIHYLVKVGLGESSDLWQVMLSAEKSMIKVEAAALESSA
jgi:aminoglycoside phosphotransferase (APT) family kinase protein